MRHRPHPVIAIDGTAGSGKSTLARGLAERLDLPYVNTGLMYRALTLEARRRGLDLEDGPSLAALMSSLTFTLSPTGRPRTLWVEGRPPSHKFHSEEVDRDVSTVARHPEVREVMRRGQRVLGEGGGVLEGRDIGTVVFQDADLKFFLDARGEVRASRRARERGAEHRTAQVGGAIAERDARDARVNPFVPAEDAVVIDTTDLDVEGVLARALEEVARRLWIGGPSG